jgi:methyltransferase-like protein
VPEPVRERIFQIYAKCLNPNGIGYISYNVFPGWHTRSIIRELMLYHTAAIEDPLKKVDEATKIVGFLTETAKNGSRYHEILKFERDSLSRAPRQGLLHDVMEADNQPFYFHQFVEKISNHGLQFLSEAEPNGLSEDDLSPDILKVLNEIGTDEIRRQQYLDFIRACRFRCSLVCRNDLEIERNVSQEIVGRFLISGCVNTESIDLTDSTTAVFLGPRGVKFSTNHPLSKAALVYLNYRWPNSVTFGELENNLKELFKDLPQAEFDAGILQLKAFLLQLFKAEIVQFRSFQPRLVDKVTEFPKAGEYARWQIAMNSKKVTTMSGISLEIDDEMVRTMLVLLDGSRDRETLLRDLCEAAEGHGSDNEVLYASLSAQLDSKLSSIAKAGLFIG